MRLELTRVGLLVELANHYTTRGAFMKPEGDRDRKIHWDTPDQKKKKKNFEKGKNAKMLHREIKRKPFTSTSDTTCYYSCEKRQKQQQQQQQ